MSIKLEVRGDYALFSRPEFKVERVSYDVITPSAARGLIEAIYWHTGLTVIIDRITVCNPIRFTNIRRNELKDTISASKARTVMNTGKGDLWLVRSESIQQRASLLLRDVRYVIEAHFVINKNAAPTDNAGKFSDIFRRRIEKGQFYHQPYFGTREFPVTFTPCASVPECPPELRGETDLGWMLYDMDYSDPQNIVPMFFRAVMRDGVIEIPSPDSGEVVK